MADSPASVKMEREDKESTAIPEEKADDAPSILPMTPESKQLAAVIATAVATAMAGRSARNLKLHLVTLPGANLASNELLLQSGGLPSPEIGVGNTAELRLIYRFFR